MATIPGTTGDDSLGPGPGSENDSIAGFAGNDSLFGGAGNDSLFGGADNDTLLGGTGADSMFGDGGNDQLFGEDGNDSLFGGLDNDSLTGGAGADVLEGNEGDDVFFESGSNNGGDSIFGGDGIDTVDYSNYSQSINANLATGIVNPQGSGNNDTLSGIENLIGTGGTDRITGNAQDNFLSGGGGNDSIFGGDGNDTVSGDAGNDSLVGGDGTDTLTYANATGPVNANLGSTTVTGEGTDTISGFENLIGSGGSDTLTGTATENVIQGGGGADTIFGGTGNDTIDGGTGDDVITSGPETPSTASLDFNWTLAGGDEDDLSAGVTQDTGGINVSTTYTAGFPGSTFTVESSNGDSGPDGPIYVAPGETFDPGSSAELRRPGGQVAGSSPTSTLRVDFDAVAGSGLADEVQNVSFRISDIDDSNWRDRIVVRAYDANGNEIPVTFTETSASISVNGNTIEANGVTLNPDSEDGSVLVGIQGPVAYFTITYDNLETAGQAIRVSDIQFQAIVADDDSVIGGVGNDSISTGYGDDTVDGGADNDTIFGGSGDDSLVGAGGNDQLDGGAGNDTLDGGTGVDSLAGGAGNDSLAGGDGIDTLDGGTGNDVLDGGNDADIIAGGTGTDTIFGGAGADSIDGGTGDDSIFYGAGDDSVYGGDGNDLIDDISGSELAGTNVIYGGAGDDTAYAGDGNDSLFGDDGNDVLYGEADNDTLVGGSGADSLYGGDGNDLFLAAPGEVSSVAGTEYVFGGGGPGIAPGDNDILDLSAYGQLYGWGSVIINPTFPGSEDGTITLTDGNGNTLGTIVYTNIETIYPCFTPGTLILTDRGEVPVESLTAGDLVMTRDNGLQPLRWVGRRHLTRGRLLADPDLQPVRIARGALAGQGPERTMLVSPQHRVLVDCARAELLFGEAEVLVPAKHLVGQAEVSRALPEDGVTYIHILFDRHEIVQSDGIWTESFQPAERMLNAMEAEVRAEVLALFPDLASDDRAFAGARLSLKAHEAKVLFAAE
jgi:Ca2+-binding RTX toxin-like protein